MIDSILYGFGVALTPTNLFYCFAGVFFGTFVGVLPGVGSLAAITLLLPLTYYVEPTTAVIMLAGVYYGAEYGGSTASILLNLPGTPSNAVTCLDGHPMTKQGRAGVALFTSAAASFVGGTLGILMLTFATPAVVALTFAFAPAEYFALMLCALVAAGAVTQGAPVKGLAMVVVGLLLGVVGIDPNSGAVRFSSGVLYLYEGIGLVPMAMGLFGVAEIMASIGIPRGEGATQKVTLRSMLPTRQDVTQSIAPVLRGTGVGSFFGALPGTGVTVASFVSYAVEKRVAKDPRRFGRGAIEGVAGPEAANNAGAQTAFIPTLALGIPGSVTMAIILGALIIHGIVPGPKLISDHPEIFWGLLASFWIGNIMLLILNIPMIGIWVRIVQIPYKLLYPSIVALLCIGVYTIGNSLFDVGLVFLFGALGYLMRIFGYPPAPVLIGFVLGPMMEVNLRRALILSRGDLMVFIERHVCAAFLAITFAILAWTIYSVIRERSLRSAAGVA